MKKFTLVVTLFAFTAYLFAQNAARITNTLPVYPQNDVMLNQGCKALKSVQAVGDTIWYNDCGTPSDWTISDGPTATGGTWEFGVNAGSLDTYTSYGGSNPFNPPTQANGGAFYNAIQYVLDGNVPFLDGYLTIAEPIDLSAHNGVTLAFWERYKAFNYDEIYVDVSNDSITWTSWQLHADIAVNTYATPDYYEINISDVAGGEATVWIRFHFLSTSDDNNYGGGYGWRIDDVMLFEAAEFDMIMDQQYANFRFIDGGFNSMTPKDQATLVWFKGALLNNGVSTMTNVNLNVTVTDPIGTEIYDWYKDTVQISSLSHDTLELDSALYIMGLNRGMYTASYEITADNADQFPATDTASLEFKLTDTIFAHDQVRTSRIGPSMYGGAMDGDLIGCMYYLEFDDTVNSVSVFIDPSTTIGSPVIKAEVWKYDSGLSDWILVIDSDEHVIEPEDPGDWVTLKLTSDDGLQEFLTGGEFYAAMINCTWGSDTLWFGCDNTTGIHDYQIESRLRNASTWYYISNIPMVRMNLFRTEIICEPLGASAEAGNVTCNNAGDGYIDISVAGGDDNFTYLWSNGDTIQDLTYLTPGTYIVTIATCGSQDTVISVDITEPAVISSSAVAVDNSHACNPNGSITVTPSGGTSPYQVLWSGGTTGAQNTGLSPGTYSYTVTDNNGCTEVNSSVVAGLDPLEVAYTTENISCHGDTDGAITLTITGGSTHTIEWSNDSTSETLTDLAAGAYIYTVTDNSGCDVTDMIVITEPDELILVGTATNVSCYGFDDGIIDAVAEGGTPPYTIIWAPTAETTFLISGLDPDTYISMLQDANNCSTFDTITITEPDPLAITETTTDNTSACTANGTADLTITGGTTPYDVAWSNSATGISLINLNSGDYGYTVTDGNGCDFIDSVSLAGPDAFTGTTQVTNVLCNGESTGSIDLTVSGGTSPYAIEWSTSSTLEDLANLTAGEYTLILSDDGGCTIYDTIVITEPDALVADAVGTDLLCGGDNNGTIDLTVTGGVTPYTILWSNDSITEDLSGLAGGTYVVTISDSNGCAVAPISIVLAEPDSLSVILVSAQGSFIDITVTGGTSPYSYLWTNSATTQDLSGVPEDYYSVTVTDANSCISILSDIGLAVDEIASKPISIYPNPTKGQISILNAVNARITVYDILGNTVIQIREAEEKCTVDLSGKAEGIYLVRLKGEDYVLTKRILLIK